MRSSRDVAGPSDSAGQIAYDYNLTPSVRLNVQQKFLGVSLGTLMLTLGLALGGLWSSSALIARMQDNAITASALRNHLEADMMHDALRADVLAALQAAQQGQADQQNSVKQDLAEHVDLFRSSIAANQALSLPPAVGKAITPGRPASQAIHRSGPEHHWASLCRPHRGSGCLAALLDRV